MWGQIDANDPLRASRTGNELALRWTPLSRLLKFKRLVWALRLIPGNDMMSSTTSAPSSTQGISDDIDDGWQTASFTAAGLDNGPLNSMVEWLNGFHPGNIHSILVARHGALAFEHYRTGYDEVWDRSIPHVEHSP